MTYDNTSLQRNQSLCVCVCVPVLLNWSLSQGINGWISDRYHTCAIRQQHFCHSHPVTTHFLTPLRPLVLSMRDSDSWIPPGSQTHSAPHTHIWKPWHLSVFLCSQPRCTSVYQRTVATFPTMAWWRQLILSFDELSIDWLIRMHPQIPTTGQSREQCVAAPVSAIQVFSWNERFLLRMHQKGNYKTGAR